jgi:hypothetical protein
MGYLALRRRFGDPIVTPLRWAVIAAAVTGAALGSKLPLLARRPPNSPGSICTIPTTSSEAKDAEGDDVGEGLEEKVRVDGVEAEVEIEREGDGMG